MKKEIWKKLREYEIQVKKVLSASRQGRFRSIFKGSGLEFDEIRPYQYGDDLRIIDWNASVKGHGLYVKSFKEEREQFVFFLVDVSASQRLRAKDLLWRELTSVLMLSVFREGGQVGLLTFTDRMEHVFPCKRSMGHMHVLLHHIFDVPPISQGTNISKAARYALRLLKRRSLIFLISDFMDSEDYGPSLIQLATRHELVLVSLEESLLQAWPRLGIIPFRESETGILRWVNSSSHRFQQKIKDHTTRHRQKLEELARKHQMDLLSIPTQENYVPLLVKFFKQRILRQKHRI
ncbi:MAG: DUF58 domain-containing protein [Cytophagales bacterium]|nr:DUF58 domain-containing protein [Cytophagales bacterium]